MRYNDILTWYRETGDEKNDLEIWPSARVHEAVVVHARQLH
jgi:predicted nuclease of predicted toxin-antitoxin system